MGTDTGEATLGILGYEVMIASAAISEQILCSENTVLLIGPSTCEEITKSRGGAVPLSSCQFIHLSDKCQGK